MKINKGWIIAGVIFVGLSHLGGCGSTNTSTTPTQQTKVKCEYNKVSYECSGSYSASQPVVDKGNTLKFNDIKFTSKKADVTEDGRQIVRAMVCTEKSMCLYEVDVTGKNGWDRLENRNNVYMVDEVTREKMLVADLVDNGVYPMEKVNDINDLGKFIPVTIVKAHLLHTHNKECK